MEEMVTIKGSGHSHKFSKKLRNMVLENIDHKLQAERGNVLTDSYKPPK